MDTGEGGEPVALPGIAHVDDAAPAAVLERDSKIFELRPDKFGGTHYTWLNGPNPGWFT